MPLRDHPRFGWNLREVSGSPGDLIAVGLALACVLRKGRIRI